MYHIAAELPKEVCDRLNIAMVYNPEEEIGSVYSRDTLDAIGAKAAHIFVMESAGKFGTRHCFARKGSLGYEFEFHGQAAHSGFMFEVEHASAILEMGHWITTLMGLASKEEDTTVNVGVAQGGTARNVVADFAKIGVDMRFKKESERIRLKTAVQELLNGEPFVKGITVTVAAEREAAPFERTKEAEAYKEVMMQTAAELGIPFEEKDRGGLSDANHLSKCTNAIIVDGMGPHGALDHSEKEYGFIPSVEPCVRLMVRLLEKMVPENQTWEFRI